MQALLSVAVSVFALSPSTFSLCFSPALSPPRLMASKVLKKCFKTNERKEGCKGKATLTKPISFWECFGPKAKPMTTRKGHSAAVSVCVCVFF